MDDGKRSSLNVTFVRGFPRGKTQLTPSGYPKPVGSAGWVGRTGGRFLHDVIERTPLFGSFFVGPVDGKARTDMSLVWCGWGDKTISPHVVNELDGVRTSPILHLARVPRFIRRWSTPSPLPHPRRMLAVPRRVVDLTFFQKSLILLNSSWSFGTHLKCILARFPCDLHPE